MNPLNRKLSNRVCLQMFRHDLRCAAQTVRRSPGFAATVVLTLALGVGANSAVFSIVNGVLLKPLPFSQPNRLYILYQQTPSTHSASVSYPNFIDWQRSTRAFSSLAAFRQDNFILTGAGRPERLHGAMISSDFFSTLGIKPILGREFTDQEDRLGSGGAVIISEALWRQRFASSPSVLGKILELAGAPYAIVGIAPQTVQSLRIPFFRSGDVFVPLGQWRDPSFHDRKVTTGLCVIGRLASQAAESSARAEMSQIAANLASTYPDANRNSTINVVSLSDGVLAGVKPTLLALLLTVSFVLLIACANVANLLLARMASRTREFATRAALGASRSRIAIQLLTESILLSFIGGGLGLVLAELATRAALRLTPGEIPQADSVSMDWRVLLFTFATSLFVALLFTLVPILKIWRVNLSETLKEGGRGSSGLHHRAQRVFIVTEFALALALLVGAGSMIQSLIHLWRVNPGFNSHNVLAFEITPSPAVASNAQQIRNLFKQLTRKVETVPGVDSASMVLDPLPLSGIADVVPFSIEGRPLPADLKDRASAIWYFVGPHYFQTMGIVLRRGRVFRLTDDENSPPVAVIDEDFARTIFRNEDPIGKRISISFTGLSEIVGVVAHVNHWSLGGDPPSAVTRQMYFPYLQLADKYLPLGINGGATVVVRTRSEPLGFVSSVQNRADQLDNGVAAFDTRTLDQVVASWLATRRFAMTLLCAFAFLALTLSAIGVYGVVAYMAGQRTREIGVRMTLGAQRSDILRLILAYGGKLAAIGISLGVGAALLLARLIAGLFYGVSAADPLVLITAAVLLLLVALTASYIPARLAARSDPLISLRSE